MTALAPGMQVEVRTRSGRSGRDVRWEQAEVVEVFKRGINARLLEDGRTVRSIKHEDVRLPVLVRASEHDVDETSVAPFSASKLTNRPFSKLRWQP